MEGFPRDRKLPRYDVRGQMQPPGPQAAEVILATA